MKPGLSLVDHKAQSSLGPFYQQGLTLIPAWMIIKSIIKCEAKLPTHSWTSTVYHLKLRNTWVISSHTLLEIWLLMFTSLLGLKLIHISKREPWCLTPSLQFRNQRPFPINHFNRKTMFKIFNSHRSWTKSYLYPWLLMANKHSDDDINILQMYNTKTQRVGNLF